MFSQQNGDYERLSSVRQLPTPTGIGSLLSKNPVHCVSDAAAENEPGMRDFEHKSRSKILTSQAENPFLDFLLGKNSGRVLRTDARMAALGPPCTKFILTRSGQSCVVEGRHRAIRGKWPLGATAPLLERPSVAEVYPDT